MRIALAEAECNALAIDQNIDPEVLRQLDQKTNGSYRVVVATDSFAMRGIDYRSAVVTMTLAIAKSFENQREAIQGFNRVGRFGDVCMRTRFSEVKLVD
jgi:superfamily II DNA/RNA helicase